jgi:tyrosyl-tRNA synthetase
MVNNHDWLGKLGYIEMLQKVGTHFTVNRMLSFDSVKLRLEREQPMTFLEFNYMILQGYDFRHLCQTMDVRLQMGGSDQWGNIVNGVELSRRMDGAEVFGLTTPLITKSDGTKMGKSVSGAVWLNEAQLPAYDYWQFWRNSDDSDVGKFLRLFTDLPLDEIARLEALEGAEINEAKKVLADEATTLLHGRDAAQAARAASDKAFEQGVMSEDLPTLEVDRATLEAGIPLANLVVDAGLAASRSDARRLAQGGGLRVNNEPITDGARVLSLVDLTLEGVIKLAAGKKKIVLIKPV